MLNKSGISKELHRKINQVLQPGEVIKWIEQPVIPEPADKILKFFANTGVWLIILWNLLGLLFGWRIFVNPFLYQGDDIQSSGLFRLLFVVVPLVVQLLIFWCQLVFIQKVQTIVERVYLVTDQRAILIQGGWSTKIKSYTPDQFKTIACEATENGTGAVTIAIEPQQYADGKHKEDEIIFARVRDPKEVENILQGLVQGNT